MPELAYESLSFSKKDQSLEIRFLKGFRTSIPLQEVDISKVEDHSLSFPDSRSQRRFESLLTQSFGHLVNIVNNKPTTYIHKNSGIPLIGNNSFGIVDRGSTLIEVKPISGCNHECIYCSVNQDARSNDFVVEADYLVDEFRKLAAFKDCELEAHVGTQGEPLLYADLVRLVAGLHSVPQVKRISMDTTFMLMSKKLADDLIDAGMTQFNVSLNAIDPKIAERMAGMPFPTERVMELCRHVAKRAQIVIAPVYLPGINDGEMGKVIEFAKTLGPNARVGIQNFLNYRFGRNPVKQLEWDPFYEMLRKLEKEHGVKLILGPEDFTIGKSKPLPKPFRKEEIVDAMIVCQGRLPGEMIAVARDRTISLPNSQVSKGKVRVKILQTKHNIFMGKVL